MESKSISKIDSKLSDDQSLLTKLPSPTFKKRAVVKPENIQEKLNVISNYITISPDDDLRFNLYKITISDHSDDDNHALLKAFSLNQSIRKN
jgi:hypothetical protein